MNAVKASSYRKLIDHNGCFVQETPFGAGFPRCPANAEFIGYKDRHLLSILNKEKLGRVPGYLLDKNEFPGLHGIRSLLGYHLDHPFMFLVGD
jgi:hypothetical protein